MELIQTPEIKSRYDKCKYKVKYWEHQFKKKNGRLPSKLDIREASHDIRLAYKTYFNLKSAALEESFQDIDGFNSDEEPNTSNAVENVNSDSILPSNSSIIEEEKMDTTIPDNVWGSHLNNVVPEEVKREENKLKNVNSTFTQKLFKNSNFTKRNPRKSLSFHHRKSETNLNLSMKSLSQPIIETPTSSVQESREVFDDDEVLPTNILNSDNIKIMKIIEPAGSKPLNVVQSVLEENFKSSRKIDAGWMERVALTTGTKLVNKNCETNFSLSSKLNVSQEVDYDSDDIIGDSDEEQCDKMHVAKKPRIEALKTINPASLVNVGEERKLDFSNIFNKTDSGDSFGVKPIETRVDNSFKVAPKVEEQNMNAAQKEVEEKQNTVEGKVSNEVLDERENEKPKKRATKKVAVSKSKPKATKVAEKINPETVPGRKSIRQRKTLMNLENLSEPESDEDNDPEFNPNAEKTKLDVYNFEQDASADEEAETSKIPAATAKKTTEKRKRGPKSKKPEPKPEEKPDDEEEESPVYELEYSIKPRIVTVPRDPNLKNVLKRGRPKKNKQPEETTRGEAETFDDLNVVKSKRQQELEKLQKKIDSGNLNENFVQVNLKKKIYARGKKTMNFSKYKKKMWKQHKKNNALAGPDMDMGGCDGGMLTCFNCGQVGHFAQNCKAGEGDKLLPLTAADQEYCPFPTLEEASQLAQEGNLTVRNPFKRKTGDESNDGNKMSEGDSGDSDDSGENEEKKIDETKDKTNLFSDDDDDLLLAETIKLEEYVKKIDMQEYIDSSRIIKPLYELQNNTTIETPKEVFDALQLFGHSSFRDGQEKAIMRILSGQSTLVTLSTGSGKSLCYQLPAYLYSKREHCISLVISPLVSLMEDQVTGVPSFLKAACLHTNKTKVQRERILEAIETGELDVLLVSPEAVVAGEKSTGFGSLLRKLPPVAFACIDEAHCVSQWSHNFRPSYLMICRILKERLGINTILGLTATATRATSDSIIDHLSIPDGRDGIISDIPLPNNLRLTVSKDGDRDRALLGLLVSERFEKLKSVIVYCTRRQECERIAAFLRTTLKSEKPPESTGTKKRQKLNLQAEPYHAGLSASRRRTIQKNFMSGDLRIVVATVAFGMGINKSDIRAVIHYNLPKNFESYVQEVGRAGRDGLPAHCHLFLDSLGRDENELQRHVFANSIDRHVIRKLLQKIFIPCSCKMKCPRHEVAFSVQETVMALDIPEENISTLLCYLELHNERYIEVLSPAYTICKVIAYGNSNSIRKAGKDCPPLAMALAMFGSQNDNGNCFEFPIIEVASAMGWDSGICKHKLKNLEWTTENNQPKRSLLTVQFANLGFRLLSPGNLNDSQLDDALDRLYQRVVEQERMALLQIHALHETVTAVTAQTYRLCISDEISPKERQLKNEIREYFDNVKPLDSVQMKPKQCDENQIVSDVRAMVSMYRDNTFTGRAIARIFFGIMSPNYPAVIWGRCKFWRAHISGDFNAICKIATREILKMR